MRYLWILGVMLGFHPASAQAEAMPWSEEHSHSAEAQRGKDGEIIDSSGGGAIPALPLQTYVTGGIQYVSGGIGDEEQEQLKSVAAEYNVQALFSMRTGAYVSNVAVRVLDGAGRELLSVDSAGPFLYMKLPPGRYTLEATRYNEIRKASVNANDKGTVKPHVAFAE